MKINAKQYALALYEITKDATKNEAVVLITGFWKNLLKARALPLLPRILYFYQEHYNQEQGQIDLAIKSARPLGRLTRKITEKFSDKKVKIIKEIVPEILGGVVFQTGDQLFDGSLKTRLETLENSLKR